MSETLEQVRALVARGEVDVTLVEMDDGWTPHLSLEDAYKLDDVRDALRAGDLKAAARLANRVYRLTPVEP
jgi:hypothetical protein